jgi:hypothetical protein
VSDQRHANKGWNLPTSAEGRIESWDMVKIAVLMDIRDELQRLNTLLYCKNFTGLPFTLKQIDKNTRKRKKKHETTRQPTPR